MLSVPADTADLSTLADENWTSLELAGAPDPADGGARTDAENPHTEVGERHTCRDPPCTAQIRSGSDLTAGCSTEMESGDGVDCDVSDRPSAVCC